MKRKLFLGAFSLVMSLMVWQMVLAKSPTYVENYKLSKMAYFTEPDTSKKDTLEVLGTDLEIPASILYSRKYIPPERLKEPKKVAKVKSKKKAKKNELTAEKTTEPNQ